jgi:hypothetical protein
VSTGGTGKGACLIGVCLIGACFTGGKDLTGGIITSGRALSLLPPTVNLLKSTIKKLLENVVAAQLG